MPVRTSRSVAKDRDPPIRPVTPLGSLPDARNLAAAPGSPRYLSSLSSPSVPKFRHKGNFLRTGSGMNVEIPPNSLCL